MTFFFHPLIPCHNHKFPTPAFCLQLTSSHLLSSLLHRTLLFLHLRASCSCMYVCVPVYGISAAVVVIICTATCLFKFPPTKNCTFCNHYDFSCFLCTVLWVISEDLYVSGSVRGSCVECLTLYHNCDLSSPLQTKGGQVYLAVLSYTCCTL
jgi:hypothetical protein